jgi:hypothetical protein
MHVLMLVVIGLVVLAVFVGVTAMIGKSGRAVDGARIFIWVWLVVSLGNGAYGAMRVGIPVLNEIAAFVPIFGIPAAVAWYLSHRFRARGTAAISQPE